MLAGCELLLLLLLLLIVRYVSKMSPI